MAHDNSETPLDSIVDGKSKIDVNCGSMTDLNSLPELTNDQTLASKNLQKRYLPLYRHTAYARVRDICDKVATLLDSVYLTIIAFNPDSSGDKLVQQKALNQADQIFDSWAKRHGLISTTLSSTWIALAHFTTVERKYNEGSEYITLLKDYVYPFIRELEDCEKCEDAWIIMLNWALRYGTTHARIAHMAIKICLHNGVEENIEMLVIGLCILKFYLETNESFEALMNPMLKQAMNHGGDHQTVLKHAYLEGVTAASETCKPVRQTVINLEEFAKKIDCGVSEHGDLGDETSVPNQSLSSSLSKE